MGSDLVLKQRLQEQGLLDRFSERAIQWAEQVGVRWIELEGELWTLVSELERKKGVNGNDFTTNAKPRSLSGAPLEKQGEPSAALHRLLQVPGVRKASIPTAFNVEGGYALSCGGPEAKEGITALVRQQIPEWALAGYTLVNVPLALAYLQHGRSDVAKATRNLTIGTTIDVGKVAAAKENAPLAVIPFVEGGDPAVTALLMQAVALLNANAERAVQKADHAFCVAEGAHSRLDDHDQKLAGFERHMKLLEAGRSKPRSVRVKKADRDLLFAVWEDHYGGLCPRCNHPVRSKDLEVEHWTNREIAELSHVWLVCGSCNTELGEPVGNGGKKRTADDNRAFYTFQDLLKLRCKQEQGVQLRLYIQ